MLTAAVSIGALSTISPLNPHLSYFLEYSTAFILGPGSETGNRREGWGVSL